MAKNFLSKTYPDLGLLIIRVGLGILMIKHGWPKITGGPEKWESLGNNMSMLGITFFPIFWGLCAALAETVGGLLMGIGLFFRPAFSPSFSL
jgi:putative oxidoreductase